MVRYTHVFAPYESYESGDRTGVGIMYDRRFDSFQLLWFGHEQKM